MDTRTPETNKGIELVQMDQASLVLARAESREPDVTLKVNMNELDGANEAEGEKVSRRENGPAGLVADAKLQFPGPHAYLALTLPIFCVGCLYFPLSTISVFEFSSLQEK